MVVSLGVLLGMVLLVVIGYRVLQDGDRPVVIDPAPTVAEAERVADFPVSQPDGLGTGWRPLSATFGQAETGDTLRIGYLTPSGGGVQLVQSDVNPVALVAAELGTGPVLQGTETISGRTWQRYTARKSEVALILAEPQRTVIVIGSAPVEEVRSLAAAVR
jgi:hypothetical protein